jgi:hypothetical protein
MVCHGQLPPKHSSGKNTIRVFLAQPHRIPQKIVFNRKKGFLAVFSGSMAAFFTR